MSGQSKILLLDIETSPNIGYTWGKYEVDVIEFIKQWTILCFAYKWLGDETKVVARCDFPGQSEQSVLKKLWDLLDTAEVVVWQNGDKFDMRKINTRFLQFRMPPPSPYKTVDTLKVARKFAFNSNKLDDLGNDLNEGRKIKHSGFELWKGCMAGDKKSWAMMKKYNKQDVELLERIYLRLRPWVKTHPTVSDVLDGCPKCSGDLQSRGYACNRLMRYKRYQCNDCGGWCRDTSGEKIGELVNV